MRRVCVCVCFLLVGTYCYASPKIHSLVAKWSAKVALSHPLDGSVHKDLFVTRDSGDTECLFDEYYDVVYGRSGEYWRIKYLTLLDALSNNPLTTSDGYETPKDFNLVVIVYDLVPMQEDVESYAEVSINRRVIGKTSQGLRSQKKTLKLLVDANTRHMIELRKYKLDLKRNEWVTIRNVAQPKAKYFRIPANRIRVIEVVYNFYYENPKQEHMKYQYKTFFMKQNQTF